MATDANATWQARGRRGLWRFFRIVLVLVLLGAGIYMYWKFFYTYSDGNRYGLIQKFSRRGNVFKTYEGELILSSIRSNAQVPIASEKFFFSVTDKKVAEQLMSLEGQNVTVHYEEKNGTLFWRGDSRYIVTSVRKDQTPQ